MKELNFIIIKTIKKGEHQHLISHCLVNGKLCIQTTDSIERCTKYTEENANEFMRLLSIYNPKQLNDYKIVNRTALNLTKPTIYTKANQRLAKKRKEKITQGMAHGKEFS